MRLTTSPPLSAECHEIIWEPKPPGTLWTTPGLLRDCFTFTFSSLPPALPLLVHLKTARRFTVKCLNIMPSGASRPSDDKRNLSLIVTRSSVRSKRDHSAFS